MNDPDVKLLIAIVLVVAIAAAGWYFRDEIRPQAPQPVELPVSRPPPEPEAPAGPKHPVMPPEPGAAADKQLVALPPLEDSDAYFLLALIDLFGADIEVLLMKDGLIDRIVTSVDNLPRSRVAEKVRPVGRLPEFFKVDGAGESGPIYLSEDNYRRYDVLVARVASADIGAIASTYRRFYPLFDEAYRRLGYPNGYFNDRLVEVIDHLLSTPDPDRPIRLVRPHVLYEFADAELEALSAGQKLLLRMGAENAASVKQFLRELRAELTG